MSFRGFDRLAQGLAGSVIERGRSRLTRLGTLVRDAADRADDRPIERGDVGPVELDEVSGRIADVHLYGPVRQFPHGRAEGLVVEQVELLRLQVRRLEVVDIQGEVMRTGRGTLTREEVQLLLADAQPLH